MNERAWWVFDLSRDGLTVTATVPADTEEAARAVLARTCYKGAPVQTWACRGSRWATREQVAR